MILSLLLLPETHVGNIGTKNWGGGAAPQDYSTVPPPDAEFPNERLPNNTFEDASKGDATIRPLGIL